MTLRRRRVGLGLMAVAIAIQFVGRHPASTAVDPAIAFKEQQAPQQVRDLLRRSCFDCHSDETTWPWYANVAPASWLVAWDVKRAQGQLNFSRWERYNVFDRADLLDKVCEQVTEREMPLWQYRIVHRRAVLSDAEITALCSWTKEESARLTRAGN